MENRLIVIVGPTASGKSDLAVEIAKQVGGEVISADSRQVYRGMNIGTGKITVAEMKGVPHHLLDVADPKDTFTVADYVKLAEQAIQIIYDNGKVPIICGGTGFYIQALVDGLVLPEVPPNEKLRNDLAQKTDSELLEILENLDPARSATIDKKNPRRVIRAIEIATELGAVPPLEKSNKYSATFIGLTMPMAILKERIHKRLMSRLEAGMIDEIRHLHAEGLSWERMEQLGLEYRYIARHLQGKITEQEMIAQLEMEICHYAKRQMTWFKKDKRIIWLDVPVKDEEIRKVLKLL